MDFSFKGQEVANVGGGEYLLLKKPHNLAKLLFPKVYYVGKEKRRVKSVKKQMQTIEF